MQLSLGRLYATLPPAATAARTASTPRAVRLRRLRKQPAVPPGKSDTTEDGFTPTENALYLRLRAKGELTAPDGSTISPKQWIERLNARRSRLRGVKVVKTPTGEKNLHVVGQTVYLPNIIFRLVRNHTPPSQPYNPYEATFRIPQSVTKTDIRSYLSAVYGVKTTYIRTDNYISPLSRDLRDQSWTRTKPHKTYKRAVVGLVDPFYYPLGPEDMTEAERKERKKWIEDKFGIKVTEDLRKTEFLRLTKSGSEDWRWRGPLTTKRSTILKLIAERRAARERIVDEYAQELRARRT